MTIRPLLLYAGKHGPCTTCGAIGPLHALRTSRGIDPRKLTCMPCGDQAIKFLTQGDPVTEHPNPYVGNELWWHKDRCWAIEHALAGSWNTLDEHFRRHFEKDGLVLKALNHFDRAPVVFPDPTFALGDLVRKKKGSGWHGRIVGFYCTKLTPRGYAVESFYEEGSVQIYPETALERWEAPTQNMTELLDQVWVYQDLNK